MRRIIFAAFAAAALIGLSGCVRSDAGLDRVYVVSGVEEGDMLKLRAGPGIGFRIVAGFPNGTALRVYSCEQTGSTRWCKVALNTSRATTGYVSWAYLKEI